MADKAVAVKIQDLTKSFKIPLEASSGIKQKLINVLKGRKGYRIFTPLKDISFEIEEGDFFGIVGRNGSGKSTLLKTIAGIYAPEKGLVHVNGKLVPFIELGVGFNPELTGRENVFLNGALLGFSHKEMEAMYDDIISFAELGDFMEERLKNYSSGMQVRLAFSIAIRAEGDILLLDEVLAVGDAAFQQKCFNYFEQLKKDKRTVIIVTHDMSAVHRFCNRAMIIENGIIKKIGKPGEIADIYTEDNLDSSNAATSNGVVLNKNRISLSISENTESTELRFECLTDLSKDDIYVGFTLLKDGMNIGEINSLETVMNKNEIIYNLDQTLLNPGVYEISGAMFQKSTKAVLATLTKKGHITIKGYDPTRGSGLRMKDSWKA